MVLIISLWFGANLPSGRTSTSVLRLLRIEAQEEEEATTRNNTRIIRKKYFIMYNSNLYTILPCPKWSYSTCPWLESWAMQELGAWGLSSIKTDHWYIHREGKSKSIEMKGWFYSLLILLILSLLNNFSSNL